MNVLKEAPNSFWLGLILIFSFFYFVYYKKTDDVKEDEITQMGGFNNYLPYGSEILTDGHYVIRGSRSNLYCSDSANGAICNRDFAGPDETFYVQSLGDNQYAIKSMKNELWATQTSIGIQFISPIISDEQIFNLRHMGNGKYIIQSNYDKQYCSDSGQGLYCDITTANNNSFELFEFIRSPWENIK